MKIRKASIEDKEEVECLVAGEDERETLYQRFGLGSIAVTTLIEKSEVALVAVDEQQKICGFATFSELPEVTHVKALHWEREFATLFSKPPQNVENSIWLTCFLCGPLSEMDTARQLLQTAFHCLPQVTYFMLLLPPSVKGICAPLSYFFDAPKTDIKTVPEWHGCTLKIRRSLVEDHDDLMPIFKKLNLSSVQDKFFLAKLLENQSEAQKTIAAQVNDKAVGMMSLSADVDFKTLQNSFQLSRYGNLMKDNKGNAFLVTLFCLSDLYSSRTVDFLSAAFECYPLLDYMILTVPHQAVELIETSLLPYFTLVSPITGSNFKKGTHSLIVRPAQSEDIEKIISFVEQDKEPSQEIGTIVDAITNVMSTITANKVIFVAELGGSIAGLAIIGLTVDAHQIHASFMVEELINFNEYSASDHIMLEKFIISAQVENKRRFFIKEILRQLRKCCVYFTGEANLRLLSMELLSVKPKRQIVYPDTKKLQHDPPLLPKKEPPYALHFLPRKRIFDPKITLNTRIVVLGNSDLAISFLEQLLFHKVTSIDGQLRQIDRSRKTITLTNGSALQYDFLILSDGTQDKTISQITKEHKTLQGAFALNNEGSVDAIKNHISRLDASETVPSIVIFGATLSTFCAISGLLGLGIKPHQIQVVFPDNNDIQTCFKDEIVANRIKVDLTQKGIKQHTGHFAGVESEFPVIKGVIIQTKDRKDTLPCNTFISCNTEQEVDPGTFSALIESCLVYDGRLVIDNNFKTSDPSIYALGRIAKYSHSIKTKELPFETYSDKELGSQLCFSLLRTLDETLAPSKTDQVVTFSSPKSNGGSLLGSFHYFFTSKPGLKQNTGRTLTTTNSGRNFVSVSLDSYGYIEKITYLGITPLPEAPNLVCLIGLHEKYLNCLVSRFDEGLIADLIAYFQSWWCVALYHTEFADFTNKLRQQLLDTQNIAKLKQSTTSANKTNLHSLGFSSQQDIQLKLIEFLQHFKYELPMYFTRTTLPDK